MAQDYWTPLQVLNQAAGELGLPQVTTIVGLANVQNVQLLSLLNAAGNELLLYYPYEQFTKEWLPAIVASTADYDLPDDLAYFKDQTQWDRSNHWPLLGPKSAQEWAWLKGSLTATLPRIRYRIANNQLKLYPTPEQTYVFAMEYVKRNWVTKSDASEVAMVTEDDDVINYNPWLLIKFLKFKFFELKGFDVSGPKADFMRIFLSLTGKDTGAPTLSLAPRRAPQYLGPGSIPDGNWNA